MKIEAQKAQNWFVKKQWNF